MACMVSSLYRGKNGFQSFTTDIFTASISTVWLSLIVSVKVVALECEVRFPDISHRCMAAALKLVHLAGEGKRSESNLCCGSLPGFTLNQVLQAFISVSQSPTCQFVLQPTKHPL